MLASMRMKIITVFLSLLWNWMPTFQIWEEQRQQKYRRTVYKYQVQNGVV